MPWLNWGAASQNCTFYIVVFCPLLLKRVRCRICSSRRKACLFLFLFFYCIFFLSRDHCFKIAKCTHQYALMGTFSRITLTSMFGTQLERPVSSQNDTTYQGQASFTACLLWPMYFWFLFFSHVWPKMLQLLLDGQDDKQIYILFFIIYKLPTKEEKKKTNKKQQRLSPGLFTKWFEGGGEGLTRNKAEQLKSGGCLLLFFWFQVCFSSCFFLPARPCDWDGQHLPLLSLPS